MRPIGHHTLSDTPTEPRAQRPPNPAAELPPLGATNAMPPYDGARRVRLSHSHATPENAYHPPPATARSWSPVPLAPSAERYPPTSYSPTSYSQERYPPADRMARGSPVTYPPPVNHEGESRQYGAYMPGYVEAYPGTYWQNDDSGYGAGTSHAEGTWLGYGNTAPTPSVSGLHSAAAPAWEYPSAMPPYMTAYQTPVQPRAGPTDHGTAFERIIAPGIIPGPSPLPEANSVELLSSGMHAIRVIHYILGVIEVLFALRFMLLLLAANSGAAFSAALYAVTYPLVAPFAHVFVDSGGGGHIFAWTTILAGVVYALLSWGITSLLRIRERRVAPRIPSRGILSVSSTRLDPTLHEK